jgi:hypothetical protein
MNGTHFLQVSGAEMEAAISTREYNRLLSMPRDRELEGDLLDRATGARQWYAKYGRPFVASRRIDLTEVSPISILLENGMSLDSEVLAQRLTKGEAHALIVLALSAGTEVAEEVARHWNEGRPDEGFFLDRIAVAITEQLLFWAAATLCRSFEADQETVLPHLSPGCGHWELGDQHKLMTLLTGSQETTVLGPLEILESGGLRPQHSILAAMGITRKRFAISPESLCRACDLNPCKFRRAPYSGEVLHLLEIR